MLRLFIKNTEAQDLVEYSLLLTFLALAAIGILPSLGEAINTVFSKTHSSIITAPGGSGS